MTINKHGGGSQTNKNGLKFEQDTDLKKALIDNGFFIKGDYVYVDSSFETIVGQVISKHNLYKNFLEKNYNVNYEDYISKQLLPDDAIYINSINTVFIIEKKFQKSSGSVDEKLQTCDFKKKQYRKLFQNDKVNIEVEYIYLLSDWFKDKKYKDTLDYIKLVGCHYYFNEIPIDIFSK